MPHWKEKFAPKLADIRANNLKAMFLAMAERGEAVIVKPSDEGPPV